MERFFIFMLSVMLAFSACSYPVETASVADHSEKKKLTVMVYMAADNDLESYALQNLKSMEKSDFCEINVLVLLDRAEGYDETNGNWTDTRLFEVTHDKSDGSFIVSKRLNCAALGLSDQSETELDMANPLVLKTFIEFGKSYYTAEKYALIIWGHGTGWRFCSEPSVRAVAIDDKTNSYISVYALGQALENLDLCVIGFDTCFGGAFENLYELKNCAEFTVACPGVTPGSGWNYKEMLEAVAAGDFSARSIADSMALYSSSGTSVLVNNRFAQLMESFEAFSEQLSQTIITENDRQEVMDELFSIKSYSYSQYPCDMYLDLKALAELYCASPDSSLSAAAVSLKASLEESVLGLEGRSSGIGVHFIPMTSVHTAASGHSSDYIKSENKTNQCSFIKESRWWVPTEGGNSGSVLDKLFYSNF